MNEAYPHQRTSPFNPNTSTEYEFGQKYNGLFLLQGYPNWAPPYYVVAVPEEQPITVHGQNRKFYPYYWTGSGVSYDYPNYNITGVVFTSSNATAGAVLKGQLMSNDQNGISSNSQRKLVRTDNGKYHLVYESLGKIWYTHSLGTDYFGEWSQEVIIDEYEYLYAKNPSIDFDGNNISIVFEKWDGTAVSVYYVERNTINNTNIHEQTFLISSNYTNFGIIKPVVSHVNGQRLIIYKESFNSCLKYRIRSSVTGNWTWSSEPKDIPNTNSNSVNPSVAGNKVIFEHNIVYQQGNSQIKYLHADYRSTEELRFCNEYIVSLGSSFDINMYPSVSVFYYDNYHRVLVSWTGIYTADKDKNMLKLTEDLYRSNAVTRVRWGILNWGSCNYFGDNVYYTNNTSLPSSDGSIIAWSELNGQGAKYVKRRSGDLGYDPPAPLSSNGLQPLISNGSSYNNIRAMVFNSRTSAPYLLSRCSNDFSNEWRMSKETKGEYMEITYGRSGVVELGGIEFVFNIGDITLNGEAIEFVERTDTLKINSISELNNAVRTNPFNLNSESELMFSNYYYVINGVLADSLLDELFRVDFKCELVNQETREIVGTFDAVSYSKLNLGKYANPSYVVNCSGIQDGLYHLRLLTTVSDSVGITLVNVMRDDILMEKSSRLKVNFKGERLPAEYVLEQNYPNPFNPTSTIRYQLPKDGMVTLKVYDILGAEVATLVSEEKVAGNYEVNFNASGHSGNIRNLASGVYIYRLNVNDFVNVKKMVLVK